MPSLKSFQKGSVHKTSKDVEKQEKQSDGVSDDFESEADLRTTAVQALFEFTPEQMRQVHAIPTAISWCRHLEDSFQPLLMKQYALTWSTLGVPLPKSTYDCWILLRAVSKVVAKMGDEGHSIEDIWTSIKLSPDSAPTEAPPLPAKTTQDNHCFVAIFAMLCWSSMIFRPDLTQNQDSEAACLTINQSYIDRHSLKISFVERPVSVVFRNLRKALDRRRLPRKPTRDDGTTVFVSTINYHSLRIIGKVNIRWVDSLSSHLEFEPRTRTLSVFRFPSFCALKAIAGDRSNISEKQEAMSPSSFAMNSFGHKLVQMSFSIDDELAVELEDCSLQLSQEVLMSYRLLFGQSRAARGAGKSLLQKLAATANFDGLLVDLCTKPQKKARQLPTSFWPISCRDFDMQLLEVESYSSQDDFPILGSRLAILQDFNLKQQPSRLRDLWRDRRNPLQWYTFWAVLIIGGISNIVAILQLVVSIIQLKV